MRALAVLALALAGCNQLIGIGEFTTSAGDDIVPDADPGAPDAAPDAMPAPVTGFAIASDFTNPGKLGVIDVRAGTIQADALPDVVGADAVIRRFDDEIFLVNRFGAHGDQIVVLSSAPASVIRTYTLPAGSNPQDVAVAGGKLYVPAYGTAGIEIVDRDDGEVRTLALLAAEDPDGRPDCVSAFYTGVHVLVACGILANAGGARGPGKIVVVDPFNDTVTGSFDLPYVNPFGLLMPTKPSAVGTGELLIATVPSFVDFSTGCLARITLGATPAANGCLTTNQALGGWANHVEADPEGAHVWIASTIYDVAFNPYGRLVAFDLGAGTLGTPVSEPGQEIADVAACPDGFVLAADRKSSEHGVRVYRDGVSGALLDLGILPSPQNGLVCF